MGQYDRVIFSEEKRTEMRVLWSRFREFEEANINGLPDSREKSLAKTKLKECLMWLEAAHTAVVRGDL